MSQKQSFKKKAFLAAIVGSVGFIASVIALVEFFTDIKNVRDVKAFFSSEEVDYPSSYEEKKPKTVVNDEDYQPIVKDVSSASPFVEIDPRDLIDSFRENPDAIDNTYVGQRIGLSHDFTADELRYEHYHSDGCENFYLTGFANFLDFQKVVCLWITDKKIGDAPVNLHCVFRTQNGDQQQALNAELYTAIKAGTLKSMSGDLVYIAVTPAFTNDEPKTRKLEGISIRHFDSYRAIVILSDCQSVL